MSGRTIVTEMEELLRMETHVAFKFRFQRRAC